jgi:hypothetical protein
MPEKVIWYQTKKGDRNYDDIVQQCFDLYLKRPLDNYIATKEILFNYYPCHLLVVYDNNESMKKTIIMGGLMWWQTPFGNKISTSFSENAEIYKTYVLEKYCELLTTPGYYAEVSDVLEYLIRKKGLTNITDVTTLKRVMGLNDADIFIDDTDPRRSEYMLNRKPSPIKSYTRLIGGILHRKALYGLPCLSSRFIGKNCNKKCVTLDTIEEQSPTLIGQTLEDQPHVEESPLPPTTGGHYIKRKKNRTKRAKSKRSKKSRKV